MKEINNSNVRSRAELRDERYRLRSEIALKEDELAVHYQNIQKIIKPVQRVMGLFHKKSDDNTHNGVLGTILKIAVPVIAGRQVLKHKKQMLLMPMLGYILKQGVSYITSKSMKKHTESIGMKNEDKDEGGIF